MTVSSPVPPLIVSLPVWPSGDAGGASGNTGDGGLATSAKFDIVNGLAVLADGDALIADGANNRVRRVDSATGNISNFAGDPAGTSGNTGDGGLATSALLNAPTGLTVSGNGDALIADGANNRVRRVDSATGNIFNFAGDPAATSGNTGDGGLATSAKLNKPVAGAVLRDGDVLIADSDANRVRRVDSATGVISHFAGNATDTSLGNTGDGGPATSAKFSKPDGVAVLGDGDAVIIDHGNNRVRRVDVPATCPLSGPGVINGTAGNNVINGTAGPDLINGLGGNDTIKGKGGNDVICAGSGNDTVNGGPGNDEILGEGGADNLNGDNGSDTVNGGSGGDVGVAGGAGDDALNGNGGGDSMRGGPGKDTMSGGGGGDFMVGARGNDTANGNAGNDEVRGGTGSDTLNGGPGPDFGSGGPGFDTCKSFATKQFCEA